MQLARRGWIACWALSIPLAVSSGIWLARGSEDARPAAPASSPPAPRTAAPVAALAATRGAGPGAAEIRAIVRDELARQLSDLQRPSGDGDERREAQDPRAPLTAELQARADAADAVIRRAVDAGRWTSEERRQFADATSGLPPTTVFELQRTVIAAINLGRLSVPDRAFPFGP